MPARPRSTPWLAARRPDRDRTLRPFPGFAVTATALPLRGDLPRPPVGARFLLLPATTPWARTLVFARRFPRACHAVLTGRQYPAHRRGTRAILTADEPQPVPVVYLARAWPLTQRLGRTPLACPFPVVHPRLRVYLLPALDPDPWSTPLARLAPWCLLLPTLTPDHTVVLGPPPRRAPERIYVDRRVWRAAVTAIVPHADAQRVLRWL